jgi:hypothetical protein
MKAQPIASELQSIMDYDSSSGAVVWKVRRHGRGGAISPGDSVGSKNAGGYLETKINGYRTYVHRIAWALHHGAWPKGNIDHKDGDRLNNSIDNLRDCSQSTNIENRRIPRSDSKIGIQGVGKKKNRYYSTIQTHGQRKYLGSFMTAEAAHDAYLKAKRQFHHGNTL